MYYAFFKIRFFSGLQYRAAALGGMVTQIVWGFMEILLYEAFYESNPAAFPMDFQALTSYIWLRQAFLALYMMWNYENDIFQSIISGNVAYELCRPLDIYSMWYARNVAFRLSRACLRCLPILIIAILLPKPYGITLPSGVGAALWFLVTMALSVLVTVAFCMIIYASTFFTLQSNGLRVLASSVVEFLSGAIIPFPFLPDKVKFAFELLPFASMQNVPLRVYGGDIYGAEIYEKVGIQIFWLFGLILIGRLMIRKALRRVTVQGG